MACFDVLLVLENFLAILPNFLRVALEGNNVKVNLHKATSCIQPLNQHTIG